MALFCAAITRDLDSSLTFLFLSLVHVFSTESLLVFRFKYPYRCFFFSWGEFPILFSDNLYSVDACIVCIVSNGCNQSFFRAFLYSFLGYVSMLRRYLQRWQVLFHLFLTHTVYLRHLWDVRPYAIVMSFLLVWSIGWSSLVHFKNGSENLSRGTVQVFNDVRVKDDQVFIGFLYSECSDFILIWLTDSFPHLSFFTFHYALGSFFLWQIPSLYLDYIFSLPLLFIYLFIYFFLSNYLFYYLFTLPNRLLCRGIRPPKYVS